MPPFSRRLLANLKALISTYPALHSGNENKEGEKRDAAKTPWNYSNIDGKSL
jgi:hypothetical protein